MLGVTRLYSLDQLNFHRINVLDVYLLDQGHIRPCMKFCTNFCITFLANKSFEVELNFLFITTTASDLTTFMYCNVNNIQYWDRARREFFVLLDNVCFYTSCFLKVVLYFQVAANMYGNVLYICCFTKQYDSLPWQLDKANAHVDIAIFETNSANFWRMDKFRFND